MYPKSNSSTFSQKHFFIQLRQKSKCRNGKDFAQQVATALNRSTKTGYKKINGSVRVSMDEAMLLAHHFNCDLGLLVKQSMC